MSLLQTSLKQTVQVDREALVTLTQESLEKPASIQRLEGAATELYKALQAGQDTGKRHAHWTADLVLTGSQKWPLRWKGWTSTGLITHNSANAYSITSPS